MGGIKNKKVVMERRRVKRRRVKTGESVRKNSVKSQMGNQMTRLKTVTMSIWTSISTTTVVKRTTKRGQVTAGGSVATSAKWLLKTKMYHENVQRRPRVRTVRGWLGVAQGRAKTRESRGRGLPLTAGAARDKGKIPRPAPPVDAVPDRNDSETLSLPPLPDAAVNV